MMTSIPTALRSAEEARRELCRELERLERTEERTPAETVHRARRALDRLERSVEREAGSGPGVRTDATRFLAARTRLARVAIGELSPREGARRVRATLRDLLGDDPG